MARASELRVLRAGEIIFSPGEGADRLYVVRRGTVVVRSEDGAVLAEFLAPDSFGELEFLTGDSRNATATAEDDSELIAFPASGIPLEQALSRRSYLAARILRSFLLVVAARTRRANALVAENSPWVRELRKQVYGDKLTGLLNKAYLEENLGRLLTPPLALIMMKPDNFKEINDRFGHEAGDAVLVHMAGELERHVGKDGIAVRYMGNELAVVYPGLDRAAAAEAARTIQTHLSSLDLGRHTSDAAIRLSMSLGVALYGEHGSDAESLIRACAGLPLVGRERGGSLILFPEDA